MFVLIILCTACISTLRLHLYPTAISGCLLAFDQVAQMSDRYYLSLPPDLTNWNTYAMLIFLALNILCFLTSRYLVKTFSGEFQRLKFTGQFAVGHKVIWSGGASEDKSAAVSVFYPVDKEYESKVKNKKAGKKWC